MHRLCFAVSVAGLVTIASALAQAQEPDTLSPAQRAGVALARLGAGQRVRIRGSGVGRVQGWVVRSSSNLVTLHTDGSTLDVPAPDVDSLWVRGRGHAGTGALVGAAAGGIGLGVALTVALSGPRGPCDGGCGAAPFFGGLLVGGAGGALVGALIGTGVSKWQLRVP